MQVAPDPSVRERSEALLDLYERILGAAAATGRHLEVGPARRLHLIEAGDGPPALFLHGTGTSSLSFLPLIEQLDGVRALAVDRPGFGLSDPARVPRERFRAAAVDLIDELLDALELEDAALVGNSMGGTWALWFALAHPERVRRLVLIGASPLLPGTRAPVPMRVMAVPGVGDAMSRVKTTDKMTARMMASLGEGDAITAYPDLIEALVAVANDPVAAAANLAEVRAAISPLGFRSALRIRRDELRALKVLTPLIWGDHDPVGSVAVARETTRLLPSAQLELLSAGHVPYLRHPHRAARHVSDFVESGRG